MGLVAGDRLIFTTLDDSGNLAEITVTPTSVDLAAQTHDPLVRWMDESGVLDMADLAGVQLNYWHVMDSGRDSVDLLARLRLGQADGTDARVGEHRRRDQLVVKPAPAIAEQPVDLGIEQQGCQHGAAAQAEVAA